MFYPHSNLQGGTHSILFLKKTSPCPFVHTHRCKSVQKGRGCEDRIATLLYSAHVFPGESQKSIQSLTSPFERSSCAPVVCPLATKQKTGMKRGAFKRVSWMGKIPMGLRFLKQRPAHNSLIAFLKRLMRK